MNKFIRSAIARSRTSLSILVLLGLAGIYAMNALPKATEPNVTFPGAMVSVFYEGVSPQDSERLLVKPLETALRTIEGVDEVMATAAMGYANVVVLFDEEIDMDQAIYDTRVKVDEVRTELPNDAKEPKIREFTTQDNPVITISLVSDTVSERTLISLAKDLQDEIETLTDVLSADLRGVPEDLLEAIVEKSKLESYGISIGELYQAISNNNRIIPAGSQDTGKGSFAVNVPSVFADLDDIQSLPIKVSGNSVVTLSDVAEIRRTYKDKTSDTRINGRRALSVEVVKRTGTNVIDTVAAVKEIVEKAELNFPNGVEIIYSRDDSGFALDMISELQGNVLTAVVLVMIVVLAALGFRTSLLVGLAIPFSYLFCLTILFFAGQEFNFMVMFGMLISMGMTIDGSIVVTEYADRKLAEGMDRIDAYTSAGARMFWPVLSSTVTTLVVFLPLMLMPGMGKFIRMMPVTVFCVLVGSLIYAIIFVPILGALFGGLAKESKSETENIRKLETDDPLSLPAFTGGYARKVYPYLKIPGQTIFIIVFAIVLIIKLWADHGKGVIYFPEVAPQWVQINVSARGNLSTNEKKELAILAEKEILPIEDIELVYLRTGSSRSAFGGGNPDRISSMFIDFYDEDKRESNKDGYEILETINQKTKDFPGFLVQSEAEKAGPPIGKSLDIDVMGEDPFVLAQATKKLKTYIENEVSGLMGLEDSVQQRGIEWRLKIDKTRAAQFGASLTDVGAAVQMVTNGIKVGEYRPLDVDDEVDIRVRFPKEQRNLDALDELSVKTNKGIISVSSFVESRPQPATGYISRKDGKRVFSISADKKEGVVISDKIKQIKDWISNNDLGPGVSVEFGGFDKYNKEASDYLVSAFILSLFIMLILLVTQFNSFYQGFVILSAILLSFGGVFLALLILGRSFSTLQTGISCVALAGIVVNNNIVLIDTFNLLKKNNPAASTLSLALRSAVLRLRPVFLTSFTTIAGLLPIALGYSIDLIGREIKAGMYVTSYWEQMAGALVIGLSVATILTLVVTPCALILSDSMKETPKKIRSLLHKIILERKSQISN
ncbi:MAG: efflux RND transporter permease subunit [SAR86 cluster bacterium]|nr:efflux RND transporter permease subunit [SAR86 cluster bacterium]